MSFDRAPEQFPPLLPPGTQVGAWRVVERRGQGGYGAVYRAVRVGQEEAGPVALKLSLSLWNFRFGREVELLSRLRHPSIPRLLDRGSLQHASDAEYPWFVMEWVEGTPLYAFAEQHPPACWQMLRWLAQLAQALADVHAAGAVHRDVKGDNVLVRHADGRAVLVDFGSSHFEGTERMTWQSLPPSTPAYHSAAARMFYLRSLRYPDAYYPPTPADDVFALGVTAYRLVMGEYPPPMQPHLNEAGSWVVTSPDPRPFLERNPRVEPVLREFILRMLSPVPEARGTAAELARALEAAAEVLAREGLPHWDAAPGTHVRRAVPWLTLVTAAVTALFLWTSKHVPRQVYARGQDSDSRASDAGTSAVGDALPAAHLASGDTPSKQQPITQDLPFQARSGQVLPDKRGRCPGRDQVAINGACWMEMRTTDAQSCVENGYDFRGGKCYAPAYASRQQPQPTSRPTDAR